MTQTPLFLKLFKESPLKGIEKHMEKSAECASALEAFFDAALEGDWVLAESIYEQISTLETEADDLKHAIRSNLPRTLLMPMSRLDLLDLLHTQDKIPNTTKDVAGLITGRKLEFPSEMHHGLRGMVKEGLRAISLVSEAVLQLHDVAHLGFSDKSTVTLQKILKELGEVEHESDIKQREIRRVVFDLESSLPPVDVMFIYRIIDLLGDLSDNAEAAGNRILCITFS